MSRRIHAAGLSLLTSLGLAAPVAGQAVDTSEWVCELCPFNAGHDGDVTAGATVASDDSAYFGDATGYDESGAYGILDGRGTATGSTWFLRWSASDLLHDARAATIEGAHASGWDYHVALWQLPRREFSTTETVFRSTGDLLALPSGWVVAPQTGGFAALDASLANVAIAGDRSDLTVGGRYRIAPHFSASVDFRRHENDGSRILGGPSYTTASLLPAPYDYTTDEVDLRLDYRGPAASLSLAWFLSDVASTNPAIAWQQPFTVLAGAEQPELSAAPDSRFQQLSLSGGYALALFDTSLSASVAIGEITQDTAFLAYTTNTALAADPLPRPNLDGSVDVTHVALAATARPLPKARLRLSYRYDERDNGTARDAWNRVIVDSFPSGADELNTPYSYERSVLAAEANYRLLPNLKFSGGVERRETDRDYQEVARQTEDTGWVGARWRPLDWLSVEGRGGTAKRDIGRYDDAVGTALGQNPLLRKYHLAYRYREFGDFTVGLTPARWPLALTVMGLYADDSYTASRLGMLSGKETRLTADLTWAVSENVSWYLDAGLDQIESVQNGSASFGEPDWVANYEDDFATLGTGIRIRQIAEKMDLRVDYRESDSASEVRVDSTVTGADAFPDFETQHDVLRVGLDYRWSERLLLEFGLTWQTFEADDWMLDGVGPATIPAVLTLGAEPYDEEQLLFGVGFRYDLGKPEAAKPAADP